MPALGPATPRDADVRAEIENANRPEADNSENVDVVVRDLQCFKELEKKDVDKRKVY